MIDFEKLRQTILLAAQGEKKKVTDARPSVTMKMQIWTRSDGQHQNQRYVFTISGKEFEADDNSISTVLKVSRMMTKCCTELNAKRGYIVREVREDFYYQGRDVFGTVTLGEEITSGLVFIKKPCKEYAALQRAVEKYTKMKLQDLDLYDVDVFGKRAMHYEETGERRYYAHNPNRCKGILEWFRKNVKQGDKVLIEIRGMRYCEDENYSREYETESYGTFHRYLFIRDMKHNGQLRAKLETW